MSGELREQILAKTAQNIPITLIAQQLGVSRQTVYKHLATVDNWEEYLKAKSSTLNRLSLDAVERGLKRGDARLGLQWLEHTIFAPVPGDSYHIHGDVSLVNAVGMVPTGTSTTSSTGSPSLPMSTGTEAAQKTGQGCIELSKQPNFLQISDSALLAELERRGYHMVAKPTEATDAEVIESNG